MIEKISLGIAICLIGVMLGISLMTTIPKQKEYVYLNRTVYEVQEMESVRYVYIEKNDSINPIASNISGYVNKNIYPRFLDRNLVNISYNANKTILTLDKNLVQFNLSCASYSMATWMGCGNSGLAEVVNNDTQLLVGDAIIFKNPFAVNGTALHQIIQINDTCILTKGANNVRDDGKCIKKEDVYYRLWFMIPTGDLNE